MTLDLSAHFPQYTQFNPLVPVWCVTPDTGGVIHRFFDTSPFSPSGRYLALTRFPFEDRLPKPADIAQVLLVDLETGVQSVVAETRGWDTQLGAQVQWGVDDTQLFFNDVDPQTWQAFGIRIDPFSGTQKKLQGSIYALSPDGKWGASPCLLRIGKTQKGYGVIIPSDSIPSNKGASSEDGVFVTNTSTGECKLLVSIKEIVDLCGQFFPAAEYKNGDFYGFHVKWNPQGDRLMFILRWIARKQSLVRWLKNRPPQRRLNLITMKADASDIHVAIPDSEWSKGGHHPNWCPDGETIMMNLNIHGEGLRFVKAKYDGTDYGTIIDQIPGSGHPTLHPNRRYILTDAYPYESVAFGDGTTPLRLIDLQTGEEKTLVRIHVDPLFSGPKRELRVDPHPAWDSDFRRIAFNACPDGSRKVYIADLFHLL
ncbi:hypothetical protein NG796_20780 [Laspinema sp. A4]|uniref:hypothetical protein n=1 Tax=Laspinema sp. D2d TaxID=2953686 RepID=UPI0021BA7C33|nr:hypothetical protein [Laspinema sp. D2d]MCT7985712.1 hypothetical protein [Laspinema sp. D2d]